MMQADEANSITQHEASKRRCARMAQIQIALAAPKLGKLSRTGQDSERPQTHPFPRSCTEASKRVVRNIPAQPYLLLTPSIISFHLHAC